MRKFRTENLKDVIIMSQSGAGKTSLGEALLFNAKATTRLGKVLDGNSVLDFEPEEIKAPVFNLQRPAQLQVEEHRGDHAGHSR